MSQLEHLGLESMPRPLRALLASRVERLGYLGELFSLGAHQPEVLGAAIEYTNTLRAVLADRLLETVAITVSAIVENPYERVQHERLALNLGMTEDEVRALAQCRPADCASLSPAELATAELVLAIAERHGHGGSDRFERLVDLTGPATAVAVLMAAGHYLGLSAVANTWQLQAPVPSPFAEDPVSQGAPDAE